MIALCSVRLVRRYVSDNLENAVSNAYITWSKIGEATCEWQIGSKTIGWVIGFLVEIWSSALPNTGKMLQLYYWADLFYCHNMCTNIQYRSGDRIPVKAKFSAPVQTGPGAHPASRKMGTGSFPGVKSGRGVTLTPHHLLVPWSWKGRAIPLLLLWAIRTVQSLSVYTRVHFTI
jgi:hypothetical protein